MFKPDEFKVELGDYGNQVDLAFRMGEGEQRVRWGCRLTPSQALDLAKALRRAAETIEATGNGSDQAASDRTSTPAP